MTATATAAKRRAPPPKPDRPAARRAQEEEAGETVTEDLFVEATGETVGEAKWAALRELERLRPGIDKAAVRFEVVTEGERGLLGVGYAPARVVATAAETLRATARPSRRETRASSPRTCAGSSSGSSPSSASTAASTFARTPRAFDVECTGGDVGVLIGRYGQTIDAIQYIVNAIVARREGERVEVTVDAAGYRERRRAMLERLAVRERRAARERRRARSSSRR